MPQNEGLPSRKSKAPASLERLLAARSGQLIAAGSLERKPGDHPTDRGTLPAPYRDRNKVEVDIALEDRRGRVVAIEVEAASTVRAEDFRSLRHLADRLGDDLRLGVVLYTGSSTLPFGPKLRAVPVSALWQLQPGVAADA